MNTSLPKIIFPEIFIGFVAPVGADIKSTIGAFRKYFTAEGYNVVEIKVTDIFTIFEQYITPNKSLVRSYAYERYTTYIEYGDQLREHFSDDAVLAVTTVGRIIRQRTRVKTPNPFQRTVFLLNQFKRKEEISLLRSIYGELFFQVSIYSRRGARVDSLSRIFARSEALSSSQKYRDKAEEVIQIDENETENVHGQRVGLIFHDADFIVSTDVETPVVSQVNRFCDLLFGSNEISPSRSEYGMYLAKAAALRSLDLSRQVGAAIFSHAGEVISLGSNEVPRAGGGTYWCDERFDDRDYQRGEDPNERRKLDNLRELFSRMGLDVGKIDEWITSDAVRGSQVMDALEYGKVVHAEMSALSDAARLGLSVKDGSLYCTTFPCHMCAKHVVSTGLSKVVFLEPYPKSLASDLHADSIQVESGERGKYQNYPSVNFEHFYGITPRRYPELFERRQRKKHGVYQEFVDGIKRPNIATSSPSYNQAERLALTEIAQTLSKVIAESEQRAAE